MDNVQCERGHLITINNWVRSGVRINIVVAVAVEEGSETGGKATPGIYACLAVPLPLVSDIRLPLNVSP